jgi:2-haloacid dehalogenase
MLDFTRFRVLTFDCYGTLINWESGIFSALRPMLAAHGKTMTDSALLRLYAELEAKAERGDFRLYRDVLQSVVRGFGKRLEFTPTPAELSSLPNSLGDWQPFPDTVAALRKLKAQYRLAIISNVDDDLFARSAAKLEVKFDHVITAQQAQTYKPSLRIFKLAQERIGVATDQWLHVGQSIFHDVVPAKSLGITTVWVNRASPRSGVGAVKAAKGTPDLEVPDLRTLADFATQAQH